MIRNIEAIYESPKHPIRVFRWPNENFLVSWPQSVLFLGQFPKSTQLQEGKCSEMGFLLRRVPQQADEAHQRQFP